MFILYLSIHKINFNLYFVCVFSLFRSPFSSVSAVLFLDSSVIWMSHSKRSTYACYTAYAYCPYLLQYNCDWTQNRCVIFCTKIINHQSNTTNQSTWLSTDFFLFPTFVFRVYLSSSKYARSSWCNESFAKYLMQSRIVRVFHFSYLNDFARKAENHQQNAAIRQWYIFVSSWWCLSQLHVFPIIVFCCLSIDNSEKNLSYS